MDKEKIPYILHEANMARNERTVKRLIVALIIVTCLMFASNIAWLYVWQLYDYTSETETSYTLTQDSKDFNNMNLGSQGDISNGTERNDTETNNEK